MAFSSSPGLLFLLYPFGLYVLYVLWNSARYRYAMYKAGCSTPVRYRHRDPIFGLDLFMKRIQAMNDGTWLDIDEYLFSKYGKTVPTNYFGKKQYATMDSLNIQTVLATQVDKFGSAPMNYEPTKLLLGEGIINTDGARWKKSRQLINPIFARAQVSELSTIEIHVRKFLDKIPKDGSTVDFQPLCKMLYLDSTTEFLFGKSANSLSMETSTLVARRLPEIFDDALRGMLTRFMLGKLKFLATGEKAWREKCAEVHVIVDQYIDEDIEARKNEPENCNDSPYSYVLLRELAKTTDNRLTIRSELMNIFFPARDSAAVLTSNAIFLLARHPNVWNKARAEVLATGSERLTFEKLKSLKYLHCIINETLRIFSPAVRSWKTCLSPCVLPHGGGPLGNDPILLDVGDSVDMSFGSMHIDPTIWGPEAKLYRPERWEGRKQDWNYIPFLGGRRICPAQQNVLADVTYVLVRLMQEFKGCENRDPCIEFLSTQVFTKESRNGAQVAMVPQ